MIIVNLVLAIWLLGLAIAREGFGIRVWISLFIGAMNLALVLFTFFP